MIAINNNSLTVRKAFKAYKDDMPVLVRKRIAKTSNAAPAGSRVRRFLAVIDYYADEILLGKPARLMTLSRRFNPLLTTIDANGQVVKTDLGIAIATVFDYQWFITKTIHRYSAYHLTEDLEINVCVYCNRSYTHTIITQDGRKIARPTLDHYFNKGRHPLLALSFYNLIPSCNVCNLGVKHEAEFELATHYHPYLDDYITDFSFTYEYDRSARSGLKILVNTADSKADRTLRELDTRELYDTHSAELKEMLAMRYKFSDNYLQILEEHLLNGTRVCREELYRIAFGVEPNVSDFGRRPFSKFKHDILTELKIISS
jgi:hypothetical protein